MARSDQRLERRSPHDATDVLRITSADFRERHADGCPQDTEPPVNMPDTRRYVGLAEVDHHADRRERCIAKDLVIHEKRCKFSFDLRQAQLWARDSASDRTDRREDERTRTHHPGWPTTRSDRAPSAVRKRIRWDRRQPRRPDRWEIPPRGVRPDSFPASMCPATRAPRSPLDVFRPRHR